LLANTIAPKSWPLPIRRRVRNLESSNLHPTSPDQSAIPGLTVGNFPPARQSRANAGLRANASDSHQGATI